MTILIVSFGVTIFILSMALSESIGYRRGARDESARPCRKCKERDEASKPSPNNK